MENTSNALLMTASILIGVMIISLGTYLFTTFGGYSKNINERLTQQQKEEFNSQFTKYETTTDDETTYCTVYDIVTIINLAKDANEKYEEYKSGRPSNYLNDNNSYIYIKINGDTSSNISEKTSDSELNEFIKKRNEQEVDNITNEVDFKHKYKCEVHISEQTKLVKKITFTKI